MDKNKKLLIVIGVLVVVAIFLFAPKPSKDKKKPVIVKPREASIVELMQADKNELILLMAEQSGVGKKTVNRPWGERNPFNNPTPASAKKEPQSYLNGILWYEAQPCALINDTPLLVGGKINGATVKEITVKTVTVTYDGKVKVLQLPKQQ